MHPISPGRRQLLAASALTLVAPLARGQADWPRQPIKLVHGFTPGGGVDITARTVAQFLPEGLGQNVVVETRPGAGGTIASNFVAKAEPDGYTLYLMASGHSIASALYRTLPFDAVNDFTMISMTTRFPFSIAVSATSPIRTLPELMKEARDKPGTVTMGHAGIGTGMHLAGSLLQNRSGTRFNEIPYKGGNLAPTAAAAGEIVSVIDNLASMDPFLQSGKLRLIAVTGAQRWPGNPDVPTIAESASPGFDVMGWTALAGPKNLPRPVVARLSQETKKVMARPEVVDRLRRIGLGATGTEPEEAQRVLASEVARWQKLARDENIKAE